MHITRHAFHPTQAPVMHSTQPWKRPFDLTLGLIILALLAPLFLIIAALVKLTSSGPVLFVQRRVGTNGETFAIYKFRSTSTNAEARRVELLAVSDREGICFKSRNDPRITPVGRWLRRLSLDELPQLFNMLKGDMSLVGPRPALPSEVAAYPTPPPCSACRFCRASPASGKCPAGSKSVSTIWWTSTSTMPAPAAFGST